MPLPTYTIDKAITTAFAAAASLQGYPFQDVEAQRGDDFAPPYVLLDWEVKPERFLTTTQPDGNRSGKRVHYRGNPTFRCHAIEKAPAGAVAEAVAAVFRNFPVALDADGLAGLIKWRLFSDYSGKGEGTEYVYVLVYEIEFWILEL